MNKFKEFKLIFDIISFDCWHKVTTNFLAGDLFNIEDDLTLSDVEYANFGNRSCQNCQVYILKIFPPRRIRELYHGCVSSRKKNKIILIINKLPKNTTLSDEIVLEKDADLNSLLCDVNIFGYFPTTILLYPEEKSPLTPDLSNLNSIDSGIDTVF